MDAVWSTADLDWRTKSRLAALHHLGDGMPVEATDGLEEAEVAGWVEQRDGRWWPAWPEGEGGAGEKSRNAPPYSVENSKCGGSPHATRQTPGGEDGAVDACSERRGGATRRHGGGAVDHPSADAPACCRPGPVATCAAGGWPGTQ